MPEGWEAYYNRETAPQNAYAGDDGYLTQPQQVVGDPPAARKVKHGNHAWVAWVALVVAAAALGVALSARLHHTPQARQLTPQAPASPTLSTVCVHTTQHHHPVAVTRPVGGCCPGATPFTVSP